MLPATQMKINFLFCHDESAESSNRGNYIWLVKLSRINDGILDSLQPTLPNFKIHMITCEQILKTYPEKLAHEMLFFTSDIREDTQKQELFY